MVLCQIGLQRRGLPNVHPQTSGSGCEFSSTFQEQKFILVLLTTRQSGQQFPVVRELSRRLEDVSPNFTTTKQKIQYIYIGGA